MTSTSINVPGVPGDGDLDAALRVVRAHLAPTPLVELRAPRGRGRILAKLETLQPTGAFKVRGALAAVAAYQRRGGRIVTASAGNHGLGIAYAATLLGASATVVVPETASPAKVEALRRYDVELVLHGGTYDDAEHHALTLAARGGTFVSAYNDPHVIAGQATIVAELAEHLDGPATIVVPVGGGGLASGVSLAAKRSQLPITVIGVEAAASRAVSTAIGSGHVETVTVGDTIADGLAGNLGPDSITPHILRAAGTSIVAAAELDIRAAVADLALTTGLVVEGAGAVTVAALRAGLIDDQDTVVVLLTGRNISASVLNELIAAPTAGLP
jgi:threonine dehydratase